MTRAAGKAERILVPSLLFEPGVKCHLCNREADHPNDQPYQLFSRAKAVLSNPLDMTRHMPTTAYLLEALIISYYF